MKYRKDFVTNSSSSSFVCDICGAIETGYDMPLEDAGMVECVNGHMFCKEHMLSYNPNKSREEMIEELSDTWYGHQYGVEKISQFSDEDLKDYYFEHVASEDGGGWGVPEEVCPFCQFVDYSESDLACYLEKVFNVPRDRVFETVRKVHKSRQRLYDSDYIFYVCNEYDLEPARIVSKWPEQFGTYKSFKNFLKNKT